MNHDIEFYNTVSRDSMSWLDNSEKLKFSADIIQTKFRELVKPFFNRQGDYSNEKEVIALWNSYFLIIGFAFENLIKGLSIEYNRLASSYQDIFNLYWERHKKGHGISNIAKDNMFDLTNDEFDLLEKLETYSIWAGRYPIPTNENKFIKEKYNLFYSTNDNDKIDSLFDKIRNRLIEEWEKNEYK